MRSSSVRFIDLFAGLGGIRLGFEQAFHQAGFKTECVMTSEIKPFAVKALHHNFPHHRMEGDITQVPLDAVPDFDYLLAGFPCQPFSAGGKRQGFLDTRGTLFFEIEKILRAKRPTGFILENVEGLVKHNLEHKSSPIGRTLQTILLKLEEELGFQVSWAVLDSRHFGLAQSRKRIFIIGTQAHKIPLHFEPKPQGRLRDILQRGLETMDTPFVRNLLQRFPIESLYGKSIKDKRGGDNNIHSWDLGLKGEVTDHQVQLLNMLFRQRRKKQWAAEIGIDWMDGMPLTLEQIHTFYPTNGLFGQSPPLQEMLDDLTAKGYLRLEHPKKLVKEATPSGVRSYRIYDETKPKGYNIVTGKLSFEINKILDPEDIAPTLVATDVTRIAVPDGQGLRRLTVREGLRLFGFPETYDIPAKLTEAFDLLGNTVAVPIVAEIAARMAERHPVEAHHLSQPSAEHQYAAHSF